MHKLRIPVGLLACLVYAGGAAAQPTFTQPTFDAGTVYTGKPLSQAFAFVNTGTTPVTILDAKASCACLKPKFPAGPILPGQQGTVVMEVHTLGQLAGPASWGIQVKYRAGAQDGEAKLVLQAQLVAEVTAEPAALQLLVSKALVSKVTIKTHVPLHVRSVQTSSPHLKAQFGPTFKLNAMSVFHPINLEVLESYPEGRYDEIVSVYTNNPAYPELKIPVSIVKVSRQRVTATPGTVELHGTVGQPVPARIVLLRDAENDKVLVERATADHPALSCTWAAGPGYLATVKVQVDHKKLDHAGVRGTVQVEVSRPTPHTVTIPVQVLLGSSAR